MAAIAVFVYCMIPHQSTAGAPIVAKPYNFVRAEASRTPFGNIPKAWVEKQECPDSRSFTMTFALKQQNTDDLHEHVAAVSHPKNKDTTFHQYWTADEVRAYFKPSTDALDTVTAWLSDNGFTEANGKVEMVSKYGNVLKVSLSCADANRLLNAHYMLYENSRTGKQHLRVEDGVYGLPDFIAEHVDFVSPTVRFPLQHHTLSVQSMDKKAVDALRSHLSASPELRGADAVEVDGDGGRHVHFSDGTSEIPNTPPQIYELYSMSDTLASLVADGGLSDYSTSTCRQGVASFIEQYYSDTDLSLFEEYMDVSPISTTERVPATQPQGYGSEAELDVQYMTSTGPGIYTYVIYIDDDDIFVTLAEQVLDMHLPPLVLSISYGADEYELGQSWVERCNTEFGKLALIGTTILASSGDSGVKGNDDDCYQGDFEMLHEDLAADKAVGGGGARSSSPRSVSSSSSTYKFVPTFPASSPYVTAVGGTEGGTIPSSVSESTGETAWLESGGGFSMYFDAPDWQTSAISGYFANAETLPDSERYTATGRAYPDISAQSVDYVIAYDLSFYLVSGTSASSPTVAGMISLINYARIQEGKTSLGFLNPALYALYDASPNFYFNDVVEGYNLGCSVDEDVGFYTATGYDPVTGLGTPKFSRLYSALLAIDD
eukprot:CAMPEP_0202690056 /NCGR_PEP_ID=MMETSP1385-20130828/5183_1 /ASSEMBLY_ACC=CAM_ASM_000861 /TAXON_ID=933848 /ORGANISM="Elphidium margaritaceum" /LENGTH=659 /DNA_ID=CAMNT_0049345285 /DNA_START=247 /DNA_END=2226 /DNA_ORIENTATION=-